MIHPCDRRTDGRAIAYTRYSIYAVARKNWLKISNRLGEMSENCRGYFLTHIVGKNDPLHSCECLFNWTLCQWHGLARCQCRSSFMLLFCVQKENSSDGFYVRNIATISKLFSVSKQSRKISIGFQQKRQVIQVLIQVIQVKFIFSIAE